MLRGFCGPKSQCTKYRHKHLSPALPMLSDSGEQTVCCHNLGVRGRSQLHTAEEEEWGLPALRPRQMNLFSVVCFTVGSEELQKRWEKQPVHIKVYQNSSTRGGRRRFSPRVSLSCPWFHLCFTAADDAPPFSSSTHTGSVCQHIFLSSGELTLVRLSSDEGFRAWHQVLPDNTHCSTRAVCTHSLTHLRLSLGQNPLDFGLAPLAGIAPSHINAPTTRPDLQNYMYS